MRKISDLLLPTYYNALLPHRKPPNQLHSPSYDYITDTIIILGHEANEMAPLLMSQRNKATIHDSNISLCKTPFNLCQLMPSTEY